LLQNFFLKTAREALAMLADWQAARICLRPFALVVGLPPIAPAGLGPFWRSHVFYKGSHGANLKLLKISGLTDVLITKAREVTKVRNFLGLLVGFGTAMQS
jgi:hypothetical protein